MKVMYNEVIEDLAYDGEACAKMQFLYSLLPQIYSFAGHMHAWDKRQSFMGLKKRHLRWNQNPR